jgi:DNA-directed RNA polymerase alpha subunit
MDILGAYNQIFFPQQKIATADKDEPWYKKCIDSCESMLYYRSGLTRAKQLEMESNINVYKGVSVPEDLEKLFNPMELEGITFPSETKNYPICAPKVDLLVGEEYMRRDAWTIRSTNETAVSSKQDQQKDMIMQMVQEEIANPNYSEEEAKKNIEKLGKYLKYNWKDVTELTASRLLAYIYKEQNLKKKFNDGMVDILVPGREI